MADGEMKDSLRTAIQFATFVVLLVVNVSAGEVAVIAHKSIPIDDITQSQLFDCYTGEMRTWDNGDPVIPTDLEIKTEARKSFYGYLGKSVSRMNSIWMKRMLSGDGDPPEKFATEEELHERVASTPGAIGFVNQSAVDDRVKVLRVITTDDD